MQASDPQPAAPAAQSAVSRRALDYPDFRILWFTTGLVAGGVWFQQVTLGWLAYDLSKDPLQVAGVVGVRTLPLLLSPITGVIADRVDRRNLLIVDQVLVTVLVFAFALVLFNDLEQLWHLYVFAFLFGILWAGNNPVRQVLIANTAPREALMNATAMLSMSFNLMRAIGPAVGGFVIAFFGPDINFFIQGVLFFMALLVLTRMRTPYYTADRAHAKESSPLHNLREGFARVISEPTTRVTTLMTFGLSLTMLAMVFNQLPVYTAEILGNDDGSQLGLLLMAMGIGGFLGTALLAWFSSTRRKGVLASAAFHAGGGLHHRPLAGGNTVDGDACTAAPADVRAGGDDHEHDHRAYDDAGRPPRTGDRRVPDGDRHDAVLGAGSPVCSPGCTAWTSPSSSEASPDSRSSPPRAWRCRATGAWRCRAPGLPKCARERRV